MATRYTDEFESSVTAWNTFPVLSILYHLSITFNSLYLWFKRTISVSSKILFNKTPLCSEVAIIFHNNYRSEEHTSELQSRFDLVCRLLLEKKKKIIQNTKLYIIISN